MFQSFQNMSFKKKCMKFNVLFRFWKYLKKKKSLSWLCFYWGFFSIKAQGKREDKDEGRRTAVRHIPHPLERQMTLRERRDWQLNNDKRKTEMKERSEEEKMWAKKTPQKNKDQWRGRVRQGGKVRKEGIVSWQKQNILPKVEYCLLYCIPFFSEYQVLQNLCILSSKKLSN